MGPEAPLDLVSYVPRLVWDQIKAFLKIFFFFESFTISLPTHTFWVFSVNLANIWLRGPKITIFGSKTMIFGQKGSVEACDVAKHCLKWSKMILFSPKLV